MMESREHKSFGETLRSHRLNAGLTQEGLAERAGLSLNAVSALERGERQHPYPRTIRVLVAALGMTDEEASALSASLTARATRGKPPPATANAIPSAATPLVGRDTTVASAMRLLQMPEVRLLTLTGPGGVGKTRLALRLASDVANAGGREVRYVSLTAVVEPEMVPTAIVEGLDLRGASSEGHAFLVECLQSRDLLLVLDNFEQVAAAAPIVAGLLAACPSLTMIVTSRVPLHIAGEQEFPVSPLALPARDASLTLAQAAEFPAVTLFLHRAKAVRPDFALDAQNIDAVVELCSRLDGLPLAIELAASWTKLLSPQAILANMNSRLTLLSGGGADRPERHQTLRAAIRWSFDLMDPVERKVFWRMSVFVGGAPLDAALDVLGRVDPPMDRDAVLVGIAALVDHSLMYREESADGAVRVQMLETIREFACEQLELSGEMEALQQAHAEYMVSFARSARLQLEGVGRPKAHASIRAELDNIRAALHWLHEQGHVVLAQQLATEMARFWVNFGYIEEGSLWTERLLPMEGDSPEQTRFDLVYWASILATLQDAVPRSTELARNALDLASSIGDPIAVGMALTQLGAIVVLSDVAEAERLLTRSLDIFREEGEAFREANAHRQLGLIARAAGDLDLAVSHHSTALALWQDQGHPWGVPISMRDLAEVALMQGDYASATERYQASIRQWRVLGERLHMSDCLSGLARVALAMNHQDTAIVLLSAQAKLDEEMGYVHTRNAHAALHAEARESVPPVTFNEMWEFGKALVLDAILDDVVPTLGAVVGMPNGGDAGNDQGSRTVH